MLDKVFFAFVMFLWGLLKIVTLPPCFIALGIVW